ncbi:predicted protein [Naegleria gruberi]|uniref:Predicted protein n=1 Tax=Naegleria gruberi TaxID=5762 RepID=D2VPX4_NAEGR|nr:uncharacterized protein NAEGRDRAFT_71019 [Naegleria gruberi]EFC41282.1 predicted protein [Naegleria gruberi]|eukprot:XP_002674026.1 predicted protein [Naegleria gruberi strain NEG-M]
MNNSTSECSTNNTIHHDDDESVANLLCTNKNETTHSPPLLFPRCSIVEEEVEEDISPSFSAYQQEIFKGGICNTFLNELPPGMMDNITADFTAQGAEELLRVEEEQYGAFVSSSSSGLETNNDFMDDPISPSSRGTLTVVDSNRTSSIGSSTTLAQDGNSFKRLNGRNTYLKVSGTTTKSFTFKFNVLTKSSDGRGTKFDTTFSLVGTVCVNCILSDDKESHYINLKDIKKKKKCVLSVLREEFNIGRELELWIQIDNCTEQLNVYCQKNKTEQSIHNLIVFNYATSTVELKDVGNLTSYSNESITPTSVEYHKKEIACFNDLVC